MKPNEDSRNTLPQLPRIKNTIQKDGNDKILKLFPATNQIKSVNFKEFLLSKESQKHTWSEKLDPDSILFKHPNFGFNNELDFEDDEDSGRNNWLKFMSCVSANPKNERV